MLIRLPGSGRIKFRMNIQLVLLFCILSALCGGNTGLVSAKLNIYTGAEGGNGTINCYLTLPGSWKFFCKDECNKDGILVKTDGVRANSGRYSINYKSGSSERGILSVTITNMIRSDSGQYTCGLGESSGPHSYANFMVRVSDEVLDRDGFMRTNVEGETLKQPCHLETKQSRFFFCKDECKKQEDVLIETDQKKAQSGRYGIEYIEGSVFGLYVTITQVKKSDTGRYKCGYGRALSPDSPSTFSVIVIDDPSTSKPTQTLSPFPTLVPSSSAPQTAPTPPPTMSKTAPTPLPTTSKTAPTPPPTTSKTAPTPPPTSKTAPTPPPTTSETAPTAPPTTSKTAPTTTVTTPPSLIGSTSGSSPPSPVSTEIPEQPTAAVLSPYIPHPDYLLPLVGCVSLVGLSLLVLLLLYTWKTVKNSRTIELPVIYKTPGVISACDVASRD